MRAIIRGVIHLLVVDGEERALDAPPSFELLRARTPEEALEKIARNRRIDAVLFADDAAARETIALLDREGAGRPPLFHAGASAVPGVIALEGGRLFQDLTENLGE